LFYSIWITTACLQALIVEFGSIAFKVAEEGLEAKYWGLSLLLGLGSYPVQQIINALFRMGQDHNVYRKRNASRRVRFGNMTTVTAD